MKSLEKYVEKTKSLTYFQAFVLIS